MIDEKQLFLSAARHWSSEVWKCYLWFSSMWFGYFCLKHLLSFAISLCGNFGSKMNTFPSVDNFISEVSPNWSYRQKTGNNLLDFRFKYYFGARLPIRCNAGVFRSRFPNFKTSFKLCAFCLDSLMLYTSTSQRVFIQWVLLSLGQNYIKQSYSPY